MDVSSILSLPEFEGRARGVMSHMAYEYVASAAADEHTLRWNRERYEDIRLRPRVLVDGKLSTETTLLGATMPFPFLLAPTAYQKAVHPDGELGTARGAGAKGVTYIVSTATNTSIEEIAKVATGPLWFQLYVQSDRGFTKALVQRVEAAGCKALCLTVDTPVLGARNRMVRANFQMPAGVEMPHLYDVSAHAHGVISPERVTLTWKDVEWLMSITKLPVLLKGILDAGDAEIGVKSGAAGIIVSNHGARNLDTVPATIEALPAVAERVAGRVPVLVDGGIRRGTDVLKALALGATAAMIGRPHNFGLAVAGSAGVQRVIEILSEELVMAMMLTGRPTIGAIDRSVIW
ncbi:MAG: alpha-hydroxy-acid oxidizing enzyme [Bacteroidetes bacterium 13_1_20CM_4_60_6]|nr:MAG: alpha-hydroxy-acid oxidizing enzyme [Bacteroidetes bacterium 13_1_20CM_4_60_6]